MITMSVQRFLLILLGVMSVWFFMGYKISYWNCEFKNRRNYENKH